MHISLLFILAGSWYKGDVNKEVNEDLETGNVTPQSNAYTINGQPGDLCPCSNGMWRYTHRVNKLDVVFIFWKK